jgi:hypothetical protein
MGSASVAAIAKVALPPNRENLFFFIRRYTKYIENNSISSPVQKS